MMGQCQTKRHDRYESHQPQKNSATRRHFRGDIEDGCEGLDGRHLGASANSGKLQHGSKDAGAHQKQDLRARDIEGVGAVSVSHFLIGHGNYKPHTHGDDDRQGQGDWAADRVQSGPELANPLCDAMAEIGGQMGKAFFYPRGDRLPAAAYHYSSSGQGSHQAHDQKSQQPEFLVVLRVRNRLHCGRKKEDCENHQDGEGPKVEYSLHCPDPHLRGEGKILTLGDEIGTNEFPGPAEQRQAGESDQGRSDQPCEGGFRADGKKEEFPSNGAKDIAEIYPGNGVKYVNPSDLPAKVAKLAPVELSPLTKLKINQKGEDKKNHRSDNNAFFVHEGEKPRAATLATQSENRTLKVNDCARRVKRAGILNRLG